MARYTGPKTRIARAFGEPIFGTDKYFEKKNYPPGQHGINKKRKKTTEYGIQLKEKQKAKYTYGVLERQFSKLFDQAQRTKGVTGEVLLQLLESRLDNVVFRLGLAPSRDAARQLVSHKHVTVNGEVVNIPSFQLKPGDIISIREKSRSLEVVVNALNSLGIGPRDLIAIEKTNEYHGLYHVLHGVIAPQDGIMPDQLRIRELLGRISRSETTEVIIATNPTIEGETTALYLAKLLKPSGIKVTRLAHGLPLGADLDYADQMTILRAMEGRTAM